MPTDHIAQITPSFNVDIFEVYDARPSHVLICIHGIRDNAAFCNTIKTVPGFIDQDITVVCVNYGRVSAWEFVTGRGRDRIRATVIDQIEHIRSRFPENEISIFSHSNGTKTLAEIINDLSFRPYWVFLCGSVCHLDDANAFRVAKRDPIVNEIGTCD